MSAIDQAVLNTLRESQPLAEELGEFSRLQNQAGQLNASSEQKFVLAWLERATQASASKNGQSLIEELHQKSPTEVTSVLMQRLSIDQGDYERSIQYGSDFSRLRQSNSPKLKSWSDYLLGKAYLHQIKPRVAQKIFDQIDPNGDETLNLFLNLDRAYLYYHQTRYIECAELLDHYFSKHIEQPAAVKDKVFCAIGELYFNLGYFNKAKFFLDEVQVSQDPLYRIKARVLLFQLYIESRQLERAQRILALLNGESITLQKSEYFATFLRYQGLHHIRTGRHNEALVCLQKCQSHLDYKNSLSLQVDVFVDIEMHLKPISIIDIVRWSKRCRDAQDDYSRHYLWLEALRSSQCPNLRVTSKSRLLRVLQSHFDFSGLRSEPLRIQALKIACGLSTIKASWAKEWLDMGHDYLLEESIGVFKDSASPETCIVVDAKENILIDSVFGVIELGRDRVTAKLLDVLAQKGACAMEYKYIMSDVYQESNCNFHFIKKVKVAINRSNQRIKKKLFQIEDEGVRLSPGFKVLRSKD